MWLLSPSGIVAIAALCALPAAAGDKAPASSGKALYDHDCAQCHGATGKGDGEEAVYLSPTPKAFTAGVLDKRSDDFLAEVIAKGGAAKKLSESMPAFPKLSQADVKNVVAYIRELGKGAAAKGK